MALNLVDLEAVVEEIQPVLTGGWIQKIHQPHDLVLTLEVHSPGTSVTLSIRAEPRLARLHFVSKKYPNPPTPP
ncbi:MAG: NFACT family protein, partial [Nitrospirota bacterium]|nr:NFACT family protein [Nitrospirota bacterium]